MKKICKTIFLLIFNSVFLIFNCFSQQITFQKTIGGTVGAGGVSIWQNTDGGYIITGNTASLGGGFTDVYLARTDVNGDLIWTKTFGGTDNDAGNSVHQTADGGFIIGGTTKSFGAGLYDIYLIKTNANGDTLWTKTFGGVDWELGNSMEQTLDGGYILTGTTLSFGNNVYLLKIDSIGNILWSKTFGGNYGEHGNSVQQTTDGGYIITGTTWSLGGYDIYLIKTDPNGDSLWTKTFGGTGGDEAYFVRQTTDGGYIITGYTDSFGAGLFDIYIIKTDLNGNLLWSKTFGGIDNEDGRSVQQTMDGGYIIVGNTFNASGSDICLIKTNANGDSLWTKTFSGISDASGNSIQQTMDGGYIIVGNTLGLGASNIYLIKTDSIGISGCNAGNQITIVTAPATQVSSTATIIGSPAIIVTTPATAVDSGGIVTTLCTTVGILNLQSSINNLQFSPNPLTTQSKLTFKNPNKEKFIFTLYDITGRVTESVSTSNNEIILTKGNPAKQDGVYLFNLMNEKTGERWNGKIVISD
jgi:regulation of enolase protein 1 (concanavalin A-like superfamily)